MNRSGCPSGFAGQYQDQLPGGDQAHHFALFFQLGYRGGAVEGSIVAHVWEVINGTPGNEGDIQLGIRAAEIGNRLRLDKDIQTARTSIEDLCDK